MKRILLIADVPGWVFERHCNEIRKRITEYEFDISFRKFFPNNYDLIYQLDTMSVCGQVPPKEKMIMGVRSEFMYKNGKESIQSFYNRIESRCKMFHVVNRKQLSEFSSLSKIPVLLAQHGVDTSCFKPKNKKSPGNKLIVGISGSFRSGGKKGFDIVQKACEITGCEIKISAQNFQQGHLNKEQMAEYYNSIDVYCNMSQSEGLNNCIMEAGATAVPVICTDVGAASEMIVDGKNGFLIPRSVDDLVKRLELLKQTPSLVEGLGSELMNTIVSKWSWDVKIQDFRDMFEAFFKTN